MGPIALPNLGPRCWRVPRRSRTASSPFRRCRFASWKCWPVTGGGAQAVIHPGDTASFTITVSNVTASAAANVVVTDQLPAAGLLSWGASSGSFTTSTSGSGLLTATLLSLPAGASGSITVSASIPLDITSLPLDLPNTATVEADGISSITSSEALITVVSGQP